VKPFRNICINVFLFSEFDMLCRFFGLLSKLYSAYLLVKSNGDTVLKYTYILLCTYIDIEIGTLHLSYDVLLLFCFRGSRVR